MISKPLAANAPQYGVTSPKIIALPVAPHRAATPHDVDAISFRQLRHHTKNALQRILNLVAESTELGFSERGRTLSDALQRRIMLAASVSDALFGLTRQPGFLEHRLIALSLGIVELLGDDDAEIDVDVRVECPCPEELHHLLVRVAHEFISNAVKHGLHARLLGRIDIHVRTEGFRTLLAVSDDGWGFARSAVKPGEGLQLARMLAARNGGEIDLQRQGGRTTATLCVPNGTPDGARTACSGRI